MKHKEESTGDFLKKKKKKVPLNEKRQGISRTPPVTHCELLENGDGISGTAFPPSVPESGKMFK